MEYAPFTAKTLPLSAKCSPRKESRSTQEKGRYGEEQVVQLLLKQGWEIHCRNIRSVGSEIDIICSKGRTLSFVEVKYRKTAPVPLTSEALGLTPRKLRSLQKGAFAALKKNPHLFNWPIRRFDLALVTGLDQRIRYFAHCFEGREDF